eukprot:CAMPEP_0172175690 /NCGR_PEP_ID=MMETSP1050-20130122/14376_1 /TAXON_ID=233186 /ORGANISM="Cryptomonas curvata, Strain CCAP979/52" /LENGTH=38 /DNA_ID= /DNA_START= /DNA_END= /DNA_ORIENTATION=
MQLSRLGRGADHEYYHVLTLDDGFYQAQTVEGSPRARE